MPDPPASAAPKPWARDWETDAFFDDEFRPDNLKGDNGCRINRFADVVDDLSTANVRIKVPLRSGPSTAVSNIRNPLQDSTLARTVEAVAASHTDANKAWSYWIFVPPALSSKPPKPPAKVKISILFGPEGIMNRHGLRFYFENSDRVLINVDGTEENPKFGVGITEAIVDGLVAKVFGAPVGTVLWELSVMAGYSTGYRGLQSTINNVLVKRHLQSVEKLIYYDCLYSHDRPNGEGTLKAMTALLDANPNAKIIIYEVTGEANDKDQIGGTPKKADKTTYHTKFPPNANPNDRAKNTVTTVINLKPSINLLKVLVVARLIHNGIADEHVKEQEIRQRYKNGGAGDALMNLIDAEIKNRPRGSFASSAATATGGKVDISKWSPAGLTVVQNICELVRRDIIAPRKLMGWGVPGIGDLCHDGHIPEFAWEHLLG